MEQSSYQVLLLGESDDRIERTQQTVLARVSELGLSSSVITFLDNTQAALWNRKLPTVAVFFGSSVHATDSKLLSNLLDDSIVVIPVVSSLENVSDEIPPQLRHINALAVAKRSEEFERISNLILESFRLLRRERKLFISYKRKDSQPFAERLYDELDKRGFDVFIDTRSVPPAVDFQSALWHRMSDCDVVVLIDTPNFRDSRWTVEELSRANATNIQILHILWPGQKEDPGSAFSLFFPLQLDDFRSGKPGKGKGIKKNTLSRICNEVEHLRARAIAWRHKYLVDNFCDAARDLALAPAVQSDRWISVEERGLAVVPAIGVPTSDQIEAIYKQLTDSPSSQQLWVLYDDRGILSEWMAHLDWLSEYLPIRTVRMQRAPKLLETE
ncbi:toll/interleukin-1 receptor domain-containing protein [Parvibaculum sp.]|uniref:toll/interleukin-1 receptor domain-containing protein n=1 Tax=Parvibaculum sp. TaxID=2024848 RepID=UPI00391B91E9